MMGASNPPADLDVATTRLSEQGLFRISYAPEETPPAINQTLRWRLTVRTAEEQPVTGATIAISGDMPEHGHGLPTAPAVTAELGNGDYLLEGLRFQMPGWSPPATNVTVQLSIWFCHEVAASTPVGGDDLPRGDGAGGKRVAVWAHVGAAPLERRRTGCVALAVAGCSAAPARGPFQPGGG
jgi:hypothetical protein